MISKFDDDDSVIKRMCEWKHWECLAWIRGEPRGRRFKNIIFGVRQSSRHGTAIYRLRDLNQTSFPKAP